jgi:hypothetical protein
MWRGFLTTQRPGLLNSALGTSISMNASAWFMIAVFVLFGIGLTVAVLAGARRDNKVEADVRREARRRLRLRGHRLHGRE